MSSGWATMHSARLILLSSGPENNRAISASPPEATRAPAPSPWAQPRLDGGLSADACIDLVEDQGGQPVGVSSDRLDRQHQARQLAARGDPSQGGDRLARVRGEHHL